MHYRMMSLSVLVAIVLVSTGAVFGKDLDPSTAALHLQLKLFDTIADANPHYEDTLAVLRRLGREEQERRLAVLAQRNTENPRIAALLDSLQSTAAYQLYYRHSPNVTPEIHRDVFTALPCRGSECPWRYRPFNPAVVPASG